MCIRAFAYQYLNSLPAPNTNDVGAPHNEGEGGSNNPERGRRVHARRTARVRVAAVPRLHLQVDDARVEGGEGTRTGRA